AACDVVDPAAKIVQIYKRGRQRCGGARFDRCCRCDEKPRQSTDREDRPDRATARGYNTIKTRPQSVHPVGETTIVRVIVTHSLVGVNQESRARGKMST